MKTKNHLEITVLFALLFLILSTFCYNTILRQELVAEMKISPFDIVRFKEVDSILDRLQIMYGGAWILLAVVLIHRVSSKAKSIPYAIFALFASCGLSCLLVVCLWQIFSYPKTLIYIITHAFLKAFILFCIPFLWSCSIDLMLRGVNHINKKKCT